MNPKEEAAYLRGQRVVWEQVEGLAKDALQRPERSAQQELDATRRALRQLCADFRLETEWPDDLHLADVVEKRITPRLLAGLRTRASS